MKDCLWGTWLAAAMLWATTSVAYAQTDVGGDPDPSAGESDAGSGGEEGPRAGIDGEVDVETDATEASGADADAAEADAAEEDAAEEEEIGAEASEAEASEAGDAAAAGTAEDDPHGNPGNPGRGIDPDPGETCVPACRGAPSGPGYFFAELNAGYGVQFGDTDYLPAANMGSYQYPLVTGPAVGGTVGLMLGSQIALIASYQYTLAFTPEGNLSGVIDEIRGTIDYHTVDLGVRLYAPLPFGRLRGELALGVLAPFHTRLEVTHGAALAMLPTPITGGGSEVANYSVGFGGHAAVGYEIPLGDVLFLALNLRYELYQSENSGETTSYQNFVTDYGATPPTAVTADITHGDGALRPETHSVQSARVQLAFGGGF